MVQLLSKRRIKLAAVFIIFGTIYFFSFANRWSGYAYTSVNDGKNPVFLGYYHSKNECYLDAQKKIYEKILIENQLIATSFACGKDCFLDGWIKSVFVSELSCSNIHYSGPIKKN